MNPQTGLTMVKDKPGNQEVNDHWSDDVLREALIFFSVFVF